MSVPEAPLHKNHGLKSGKYHVRLSRQTPVVKLKSQTPGMQPSPDKHLRLCVLSPDPRHDPTALSLADNVRHLERAGDDSLPYPERLPRQSMAPYAGLLLLQQGRLLSYRIACKPVYQKRGS